MLRNPAGTSHTKRRHQHQKRTKRSKYQKTSNERQGIPPETGRNDTTTNARHTSNTRWTQGTTPRKTEQRRSSRTGTGTTETQNSVLEGKASLGHDRRGRGAKKTQPDIEALHRQIRELLDRRERSLKNEDNYRRKVTDQQAKIERHEEDVQGLGRTVAGAGFSLGRLKKEVDNARKENHELGHRNHELKKGLRRAGRKLLDLGN